MLNIDNNSVSSSNSTVKEGNYNHLFSLNKYSEGLWAEPERSNVRTPPELGEGVEGDVNVCPTAKTSTCSGRVKCGTIG